MSHRFFYSFQHNHLCSHFHKTKNQRAEFDQLFAICYNFVSGFELTNLIMYGDVGSSDAIARDMNSLLHSSTFKHPSEGEFAKIKELISSDSYSNYNHHEYDQNLTQNQNHNHNQNQNNQRSNLGGQTETSLTRYRSAPSSFYANILDDFLDTPNHERDQNFFSQQQPQQQQQQQQDEFLQYGSTTTTSVKVETKDSGIQKLDGSPQGGTDMYGVSSHKDSYLAPNNNNGIYDQTNGNNLGSSATFRSTNLNLIRQSSSPAGFLSSLNDENGFTGMRDVKKTFPSSRLTSQINFSSGPETSSLKRTRDGDSISLDDRQNGASGHYTPSLVHHMSLPKTSSEMAVAENYLRFEQDSTPCNVRAKRGCATHPRSIAERVRRNRINDRMDKLQDLFPDMDKQTSKADMLDMVVRYIKDLKKDLQTLKDARSRCTCSSQQLHSGSTT